MTSLLTIVLPVLIILLIVIPLKLRAIFSFLLIITLSVCSPFIVNFVYCSVLSYECQPDALKAAGYLLLTLYVIVISSVIYIVLPKKLKHKQVQSSWQQTFKTLGFTTFQTPHLCIIRIVFGKWLRSKVEAKYHV